MHLSTYLSIFLHVMVALLNFFVQFVRKVGNSDPPRRKLVRAADARGLTVPYVSRKPHAVGFRFPADHSHSQGRRR